MERSTQTAKFLSSFVISGLVWVERMTPITATAIGTIMAAVAELETQAERKAVEIIRPKIICFGFVPKSEIVTSAMRRSRCQR